MTRNPPNANMQVIMELVLAAIERLPDPPRKTIEKDFTQIKELVMDSRPPRILIVGRRGAGKSSLINSIFNDRVADVGSVLSETGEARWHEFQNAKGALRILDTRGLGDRTKPESANFQTAIEEIRDAVSRECPDAVLFLCKAKEVDAHIAEDLRNLMEIRSFVKTVHKYELPLVAAVTQVDELDPKKVDPPFNHPKKQANIHIAVQAIEDACREAGMDSIKTLPVCAYAEYDEGQLMDSTYWNIDLLVEFLIGVLPKSAQMQMARISSIRQVQKRMARMLIGSTATICAGIAAVPIPVADLIPITGAQIVMISGIGYLAGREVSKDNAKEFLAALGLNLGAGYMLREAARALIKFVFPGGGSVISAGVAFAGTWAIGEAAAAYFIEGKSIEDVKRVFNETRKEKEAASHDGKDAVPIQGEPPGRAE